jgi:hypothetical protein
MKEYYSTAGLVLVVSAILVMTWLYSLLNY